MMRDACCVLRAWTAGDRRITMWILPRRGRDVFTGAMLVREEAVGLIRIWLVTYLHLNLPLNPRHPHHAVRMHGLGMRGLIMSHVRPRPQGAGRGISPHLHCSTAISDELVPCIAAVTHCLAMRSRVPQKDSECEGTV